MIKNLLFDLGGVIMDIDKDNCVRAFARLGMPDPQRFFGEYAQNGPFAAIENGAIDVDTFHRQVRELIPAAVTDAQIDAAFCDFLMGIPVRRLEQLRRLRQRGLGVYMLSNTNPIMWNSFIAEQFRQEGLSREQYFDGMVTSFVAKALKPSAQIFDYAQRTLHINPAETLFLDDSQANCDAANALGWKTAHVPPGTEFADILAEILG